MSYKERDPQTPPTFMLRHSRQSSQHSPLIGETRAMSGVERWGQTASAAHPNQALPDTIDDHMLHRTRAATEDPPPRPPRTRSLIAMFLLLSAKHTKQMQRHCRRTSHVQKLARYVSIRISSVTSGREETTHHLEFTLLTLSLAVMSSLCTDDATDPGP